MACIHKTVKIYSAKMCRECLIDCKDQYICITNVTTLMKGNFHEINHLNHSPLIYFT